MIPGVFSSAVSRLQGKLHRRQSMVLAMMVAAMPFGCSAASVRRWRGGCSTFAVSILVVTIGLAAASAGVTIDSMDTSTIGGNTASYLASSQNLFLLGWPQQYHLSDGSQWHSGAGTFGIGVGTSVSETVQDGTIQYMMSVVGRSDLLDYTDYDSGNHSSQGALMPYGPLVLDATIGSRTATMHGYTEIFSNDMTWYGEPRFNYYSASVGQVVPFDATFTLATETWQPGIFQTDFYYDMVGHVDFTQPVPEPSTVVLLGIGAICLLACVWRRRRKLHNLHSMILATMVVLAAGSAQADVFNMGGTRNPVTGIWTGQASLEFVPVGDPGNAGEQSRLAYGDTTYYGAVAQAYQMGKYDVTASQYCQFLNAVAKTDTYGLYSTYMATGSAGCGILQSGVSGSYTYSVTKSGNYPVNCVSWGDAARFCNWLQNGQPTGAEGSGTTETGTYTLNGDTVLMTATRNVGAKYFLPSENEWYKAAYYKSGGTNAGYWTYPTQSNTAPDNSLALAATESNDANYTVKSYNDYTDPTNYLTPVGTFAASPSAYGTYDMGGDVWQWDELNLSPGTWRGYRGGSFGYPADFLASSSSESDFPDFQSFYLGFRVASIPEPGSLIMLAGIALAALLYWRWQRV
jgi:formylglycine-generating enzyme required for sulfatase activity